jgi:hypothetical protein
MGACVCGLCTQPCGSNGDCVDPFAGECATVRTVMGGSACGPTEQVPNPGVCLPACASDHECGKGFACRQSFCVSTEIAKRLDSLDPPPDAGLDPGACDCSATEVSLDCICQDTNTLCPDFAGAKLAAYCGGLGGSTVQTGCGMALVSNYGGGFGGAAFLYQGSEHTLIGAQVDSDAPFGSCQHLSYSTQMPNLRQCADYALCSLCDGAAYPKCSP